MPDRRATMHRICRGCGCTDTHACVSHDGEACSWILLDISSPSGICSFCGEDWEFDLEMMGKYGWERVLAPATTMLLAP